MYKACALFHNCEQLFCTKVFRSLYVKKSFKLASGISVKEGMFSGNVSNT